MNSKNMAIIIAVAVIVIAVAGFTWYSFDQDQDEGYRQIEVGDYFLYQAYVQDSAYGEATSTYYYREYVFMSDETGLTMITATSGEDYYTYSYYLRYISMIDPVRTGTLEFMGEEVLCDVYEITTDGETWTYWIDQRTGANLMCQSATDEWNYTFELMESSVYGATVSVDVNQQETEVEPGDVVSYLVREYGIDGVFMQRFVSEISTRSGLHHFNKVLENSMTAANRYGRAICVMYDLSGMKSAGRDTVLVDIGRIAAKFRLFDHGENPSYLYHNGRPLVTLWGVGFNDGRPRIGATWGATLSKTRACTA